MTPKLWQTAAGKTQGRGIKHWRMHKFGVVALIPVVAVIPIEELIPVVALIPVVVELLQVVACKWGNVLMLYDVVSDLMLNAVAMC